VAYTKLLSYAGGDALTILDVGGSVSRARDFLRHQSPKRIEKIIVLTPNIDSDDLFREHETSDSSVNCLTMDLSTFLNLQDRPQYDAVMFVHSIYYIDPDQVALAVRCAKLRLGVSVHHPLSGLYTDCAFLDGEMRVTMVDAGNACTCALRGDKVYQHSTCRWLNNSIYTSKSTPGYTLALSVNVTMQCLYTEVVLFKSVDFQPRCVERPSSYVSIALRNYNIPDWAPALYSVASANNFLVNRLICPFIEDRGSINVLVNSAIVDDVLNNTVAYTMTIAQVRLVIRKIYSCYKAIEDRTPNCNEVSALLQLCMSNRQRTDLWVTQLLTLDTTTMESAIASDAPLPILTSLSAIIGFLFLAGFLLFIGLLLGCIMFFVRSRYRIWYDWMLGKARTTFGPAYQTVEAKVLGCYDQVQFAVQHGVSKLPVAFPATRSQPKTTDFDPDKVKGISVLPRLQPEKDETKPAIALLGPYTPQAMPIAPIRGQAALVESIKYRACIKIPSTPHDRRLAFDKLHKWLYRHHTSRVNWIASVAQRLRHDQAAWRNSLSVKSRRRASLDMSQVVDDPTVRNIFTKMEKINAIFGLKYTPVTARLVSGVSYIQHAKTGPVARAIGEIFHEDANNFLATGKTDSPFIVASGQDPVTLGQIVDLIISQGFTHVLTNDFKKFDGHVSEQASNFEIGFYKHVAALSPDEVQAFTDQIAPYCRSQLGVRWRKVEGRNSGDSNTSVGNSFLNGVLHAYVLRAVEHRILVCGDDALIFLKQPCDFSDFSDFGFEIKRKIAGNILAADFLSGSFVPSIVDHKPQLVLVPLIGKCLPKLFWSVSHNFADQPAALFENILTSAEMLYRPCSLITHWLSTIRQRVPHGPIMAVEHETPWWFATYGAALGKYVITPSDCTEHLIARYGSDDAHDLSTTLFSIDPRLPIIQPFTLPDGVIERDN
jgi:hypothetical protein